MRSFVWKGSTDRGLHMVNWHEITKPTKRGGLGIRRARQQNVSLLGKLAAELVYGSQKLWSQVLADIYLRGRNMFEAHKKKGSTTWNSIHKAFKLLKDGFRFKVGDGHTSFWFTPWLDKEPLASHVPYVDIHDVELKICDVWVDDSWQLETLYTRLPNDLVNKLLHVVPRLASGLEDTWVWGECSSGLYCECSLSHAYERGTSPSGSELELRVVVEVEAPFEYSILSLGVLSPCGPHQGCAPCARGFSFGYLSSLY